MRRSAGKLFLRRGWGLILSFGLFLGVILGLGVLRFHAARMAYTLESLNLDIQKLSNEETALKQEISALAAPVRIYSYCRERLGMQKVADAETMSVPMRGLQPVRVAAAASPKKDDEPGWQTRAGVSGGLLPLSFNPLLSWLWGK